MIYKIRYIFLVS